MLNLWKEIKKNEYPLNADVANILSILSQGKIILVTVYALDPLT